MGFELTPLPYPMDALEPHISERTLRHHHGAHHRGYVDKLNAAIKGRQDLLDKSLEQLVRGLDGAAFNSAAQAWNHAFYWKCMGPEGGGEPHGDLAGRIKQDFGRADRLRHELAEAATGQFGSGWAWLVVGGDGVLRVLATHDAETPIDGGTTPLLTIDVWEHAYYLDHQHERGKYVEAFLDHLVQWDFAAEGYASWSEAAKSAEEVA